MKKEGKNVDFLYIQLNTDDKELCTYIFNTTKNKNSCNPNFETYLLT